MRTWVPGGNTVRICLTSCCGAYARRADARMSSSLPSLSNSCWAVARLKPASVAPPSDAAEPNFTRPETRIWTTGPCACTPIVSPTLMCFFLAVEVSITTWFAPGQPPLVSFSDSNCGRAGSTLKPRFGAPPNEIALPFFTSCGSPATPPIASFTSGSARTFTSSDWSNDGVEALPPTSFALLSSALRPVIVASVFW